MMMVTRATIIFVCDKVQVSLSLQLVLGLWAGLLSNNPQIWIINFTFAANIENAQWQHCTDAAVCSYCKVELQTEVP